MSSDPLSNSRASSGIYARRVPGISDGQLAEALTAEQQRRTDEPTINAAFSRTSPELFFHHNSGAAAATQPHQMAPTTPPFQSPFSAAVPPQPAPATPVWGTAVGDNFGSQQQQRSVIPMTAQQADQLMAAQAQTSAAVAQLTATNAAVNGPGAVGAESLQTQMARLQSSVSTQTWLIVGLGLALLALLIVIVVLVSKAYAVACTNQTDASASPNAASPTSAPESSGSLFPQ